MGTFQYIKENKKVLLVTSAILVCELCERLTYYGLTANMVLYLKAEEHLGFSSADAAVFTGLFTALVYLIPLVGGYISDSLIGRFHTIWGSLVIYIIGAVLVPLSSLTELVHDKKIESYSLLSRRGLFFGGLIFIALGTGGIKSNVSPFGAQQVESLGPSAVQSFFNWFYVFINIGSAIAFIVVTIVQQNNFFWGYFILLLTICLSIIVFLVPAKAYKRDQPKGSALARVFRILNHAIQRKRKFRQSGITWLDHARDRCGGRFSDEHVDEVISLGRVIPIFATYIMYWILYYQMQGTFVLQAVQMDLMNGVPPASMNLFNTITILIFSPLVDKLVYPVIKRKTGKDISYFKRIGLGFILASVAILIAGITESARKADIHSNGYFPQDLGALGKYNASYMNVFYQTPAYLVIGLSEIFASVTGLEFAFAESPVSMKGIVMGLFLLTSGLGSGFGSALIEITNAISSQTSKGKWYTEDMNVGYLDYWCYLLAALMVPNLVALFFLSFWYGKRREIVPDNPRKSSVAIANPAFVDDEWRNIATNSEPPPAYKPPMDDLSLNTQL